MQEVKRTESNGEQMKREIEAMKKLKHQNIVNMHGFCEGDGNYIIIMVGKI